MFAAALPAIFSGLLQFASWLFGTKTGRVVLLVVTCLAAFGAYTFYIKHEAATQAEAKVVAKEERATETEHNRRDLALEVAQRRAATLTARLAATEHKNAQLLQKIRQLSAAHDNEPCIDRLGAERLRSLGPDR